MKKLIFTALLFCATLSSFAQNMYDALDFSVNNYYGTARSIGLGNAVTALGGDLGTIGINPAGSAVSSYGQFTMTPGLTMSVNNATMTIDGRTTSELSKRTRMTFPNIGINFVVDTYRTRGLKSYSFGMTTNSSNVFTDRVYGAGTGMQTSLAGAIAAGTEAAARQYGYTYQDFNSYESFYNTAIPWDYLVGYQSALTSDFGDGYSYIGSTEISDQNDDGTYNVYTAGDLNQSYLRTVSGSKQDIVMNFGMNFNDNFYLGFNLGLPVASYSFYEQFNEKALNPSDFSFSYDDGTQVMFNSDEYRYAYTASYSGIYAKAGLIWLPTPSLRIGAAIQTPTLYTITEKFQIGATTQFNTGSLSASSPENEYVYDLTSPYRANFGVAYTIGRLGLVSVDYELCDYSTMKFSEHNEPGSVFNTATDYFADANKDIRTYCGISHMLRAGAEIRPIPSFSVRAGYSLATSPEAFESYYTDAFSAGVGYSSDDSFFLDFAARLSRYPRTYYYPYDDYMGVPSPEVGMKRSLIDAVLTLGWRF